MSSLKEILGFERFHLRDLGRKIKDDPKQLLLGGVDPWSTKLWNHTGVGKDWEPMVDQMGGAYGGSTLTLGDTGEGVYGRAKAAGVPTEAGAGMHDIAHVIASIYAGGYGADKLGGLMGGSKMPFNLGGMGGGQGPVDSPMPQMRQSQQPQVAAVAANENPAFTVMTKEQRRKMLADALGSRYA